MAYKFYIGQTLTRLILTVKNFILTGASNGAVLYSKPDQTTGEVPASISGQSLIYNLTPQINPGDSGRWSFQGRFDQDGETFYTDVEYKDIKVLPPL